MFLRKIARRLGDHRLHILRRRVDVYGSG